MTSFFSADVGPIWKKISETGAEWRAVMWSKLKPDVAFQYGGRLGEFSVIPEPRITLQGAATWWIHCHDSSAICHIAGCSQVAKSISWSCHIVGCKNSIRHIENRFMSYLLSRHSRQRERLSASVLSICLSVSLSVSKMQKRDFLKNLAI